MFYVDVEYTDKCDKVRSLNFVGLAVKLGFDKVAILDKHTFQELDYYQEADIIIPWIDEALVNVTRVGRDSIGGLMDGKWWLKHQMNANLPFNNVIPYFGIKFKLTRSDDENRNKKWRWGLSEVDGQKRVVVIYKTKRLSVVLSAPLAGGAGFGGAAMLAAKKSLLKTGSNQKGKKSKKGKKKDSSKKAGMFTKGGEAFNAVCYSLVPEITKQGW
mmetsp:Transcript_50370/g.80222  ORF Transcript_50370/g.80222 Transcript_50370/m.80222 type:complete len:215 (-) Transcript_50370:231-875(-)